MEAEDQDGIPIRGFKMTRNSAIGTAHRRREATIYYDDPRKAAKYTNTFGHSYPEWDYLHDLGVHLEPNRQQKLWKLQKSIVPPADITAGRSLACTNGLLVTCKQQLCRKPHKREITRSRRKFWAAFCSYRLSTTLRISNYTAGNFFIGYENTQMPTRFLDRTKYSCLLAGRKNDRVSRGDRNNQIWCSHIGEEQTFRDCITELVQPRSKYVLMVAETELNKDLPCELTEKSNNYSPNSTQKRQFTEHEHNYKYLSLFGETGEIVKIPSPLKALQILRDGSSSSSMIRAPPRPSLVVRLRETNSRPRLVWPGRDKINAVWWDSSTTSRVRMRLRETNSRLGVLLWWWWIGKGKGTGKCSWIRAPPYGCASA